MCGVINRRTVATVAALSAIQSLASIAFGTIALLSFACIFTPLPPFEAEASPTLEFKQSFYLQYFHSRNNCMAQNTPYWNNISDFERGWNMTRSWAVNGWMAGYMAENILWLISSFLLALGMAINSCKMLRTYSVLQVVVILYDVVLVVIFAIDFSSYNAYSQLPMADIVTPNMMLSGIILMVLIFGRFGVLFVMNVVFVYNSLALAKSIGRRRRRIFGSSSC